MTLDDIDLDNAFINVNKTLVYAKYLGDMKKEFHIEPPKTRSSIREIPINSVCRAYLEKQMRLKEILDVKYPTGCKYLFVSSRNNPLNTQTYNDAIDAVLRQINYRRIYEDMIGHFSGHTFRHTFATRCFEAGIAPKVVQKYLGHATLQMTMDLYTHVMEDRLSFDIERLCNDRPNDKDVDFA